MLRFLTQCLTREIGNPLTSMSLSLDVDSVTQEPAYRR